MTDDAEVTTVPTNDGRRLAYLEAGDPTGPLVLHNHGGPGSRFEAQLLSDSAARNGIRLVCVDRPGMGRSTPQKARTFSGWAADLMTVADALGCHEFGVTGWSEGGPWALAAAAYLDPARLRHVSSIAGGSYGAFGDNSAARHLSKIDALGGFLALHFEPGFRLMYATLGLTAEHFRNSFTAQVRKSVNDYDRDVLARQDVEDIFATEMAECFTQGSNGLVRDAELLYRHWAFDVKAIDRPVHMWQGTDDTMVPSVINEEVAAAMPGAVWHSVPGAGHFVAVGAGDEIFAIAAEDLTVS